MRHVVLRVSLVLSLWIFSACRHAEVAPTPPPPAPRPCYGPFIERLLRVHAERAQVYPAYLSGNNSAADLLTRLGAVAAVVEDSPAIADVLCPVVERFGEVPPAAVPEERARCGSSRSDNHHPYWSFSISRDFMGGDFAGARRWLGHTLDPNPRPGRSGVPTCDCATRFVAENLDATLELLERPDLGADPRRALLAFAIALDALGDQATALDERVAEYQLKGLWIVCADLPKRRAPAP
ncbi:hypothetical protein ACLESD_09275 [Pyxidicoccus sp. 3LFB2]